MTVPAGTRDPAGVWSTRWGRLAGFVVLLWTLWYLAQLVVLRLDPVLFRRVHEWSGALGARLAACVVLVALLYHALGGIRIVLLEAVERPSRRLQSVTDAAVLFVWLAIGIPAAAVILWPAIDGRMP